MNTLTHEFLAALAADHAQPRLSLYLPTHRHHPENQQDPIRYMNLVKMLATKMKLQYPVEIVQPLLETFESLGRDTTFWNHTLDGLAVFAAPGWFKVVGLPRSLPELTVVADTFHTKPLRRFLQSVDRYQILGLDQHGIRLFEGDRHSLKAIDPAAGVPRSVGEALGEELTEPHRTVASYGGVGGNSNPMNHGHGGKSDEVENDATRFFRAVDRGILECHSRPTGLPLILAALPEHHALFHKVSHNSFLVSEGIKVHPDSVSPEELRGLAWEIFEPDYDARIQALTDKFVLARSKNLGMDDLTEVGEAAVTGRIATLLIESEREIVGRLHEGSGNVHLGEAEPPQTDDLLDDLGEWVIKNGGEVYVVPAERMPTKTGAAAICRY